MSEPTFTNDIMPIFAQYQEPMMWRFDLTNYYAVKDNAELIWGLISTAQMPPPPFDPLTDEFLKTFKTWMENGCPQ